MIIKVGHERSSETNALNILMKLSRPARLK